MKFVLSGSAIVKAPNGLTGTVTPTPVEFANAFDAIDAFREWVDDGCPPVKGQIARLSMTIEVLP